LVAHASPESPTVPYAIEAKARPELGWDWGKGATDPQFQIHLENKALTFAGLMSPRVSQRGSLPSLSRLLQDFRIRCLDAPDPKAPKMSSLVPPMTEPSRWHTTS
jgi:hypothetical protein